MPKSPIPENPEADADAARVTARIGKRLHAARLASGKSLRTAAQDSGLSHDALRRVENGEITASFRTVARACRAVGLRSGGRRRVR